MRTVKQGQPARARPSITGAKQRLPKHAAETAETDGAKQFNLETAKTYYLMADDAEKAGGNTCPRQSLLT
jgi:hypothetical protein